MDFLESLFPYTGIYQISDNTFSAYYIVILIFVFARLLYLLLRANQLIIKNLPKTQDQIDGKGLEKNKYLNQAWLDYQNTFTDFSSQSKTEEHSDIYFNDVSLLSRATNLRLLSSGPSVLIGLGILGTFIGLTMGITSFDTENTEAIKRSITILLSGMGTAFSTSIWGMFLSVAFTFLEKRYGNKLSNQLHNFCYFLDRKYKATAEDRIQLELSKRKELLFELFGHSNENGQTVSPGNLFRDLHQESVQQTAALKEFSSDLAFKIESGFDDLLNDQKESIAPLLEVLGQKIDSLAEKLNNPAKEMTEGVIDDLKAAINDMVNELKSSVSDATKEEMRGIAAGLMQASEMLNSIPTLIKALNSDIKTDLENVSEVTKKTIADLEESATAAQQQFDSQQRQLVDNFNKSLEQAQEQNLEHLKSLNDTNIDSINKMMESQGKAVERLEKSISGLQENQENLIKGTDQSLIKTDETVKSLNATTKQFGKSSESLLAILEELKGVHDKISASSDSFHEVSTKSAEATRNLSKAQMEFLRNLDKASSDYDKTIQKIQDSIHNATNLSEKYTEDFNSIEEALDSIFEKIQDGLRNYESSVRESAKNYLDEYTKGLVDSTKAISGTVSLQNDAIEELSDTFERLTESLINR